MTQTKRHPYDQWSPDARALDVMGDKWTLLIVRDLLSGPRRFVNLQRTLPGISTEQLRSRLNTMVEQGLLTRTRYREVPPRVDYELTAMGRDLAPVLGALARWGWAWQWGAPRRGEDVGVTALFRLAPTVLAPSRKIRGVVELGVDGESFYTLTLTRNSVDVSEGRPEHADATMLGDGVGWISALLEGDTSRIDLLGEQSLASYVLNGLRGGADVAALRPDRQAVGAAA